MNSGWYSPVSRLISSSKRAVGGLELEAAVLELLHALDDPRRRRVVQVAARVGDHRALAGQLAHQHLARVADLRRVDVLERQRIGVDARDVHPALVRERVLAHVGLVRVGRQVEHLRDHVRGLGQTLERRQAGEAHLELQVRDDRDQVRVAAALAVAVHRALHHHGALGDGGQRVGHRALRVVVRVDAQRGAPAAPPARPARPRPPGAAATRRSCRTSSGSRRPPASAAPQALDRIARIVAVAVEEVLGVVDDALPGAHQERRPTRRSSAGSRRGRRARPSRGAAPRSCRPAWTPASTTRRARAAPRPPRPRRRAGASSRTRKRLHAARPRAGARTAPSPSGSRSGSRPRSSARRARRGCARRAPSPRRTATCPRPASRRAGWCRRR